MKLKIVFIGIVLLVIGVGAIFFSLVQIPFQEQEPYYIPKSSVLLEDSLVIPARGLFGGGGGEISRTLVLNEGDEINIYFRVISGGDLDVDFHFREGMNTVFSLPRASSHNSTVTIDKSSTYYVVWDNSFSTLTDKTVSTKISKLWNEIGYNEITVYHTVIPSEYSTITEYFGIAFVLAGIVVMIWGFVSKEKTNETQTKDNKQTENNLSEIT